MPSYFGPQPASYYTQITVAIKARFLVMVRSRRSRMRRCYRTNIDAILSSAVVESFLLLYPSLCGRRARTTSSVQATVSAPMSVSKSVCPLSSFFLVNPRPPRSVIAPHGNIGIFTTPDGGHCSNFILLSVVCTCR